MTAFYTFQVMRGVTLGRQYWKVRKKAEPEGLLESEPISPVEDTKVVCHSMPYMPRKPDREELTPSPKQDATRPLLGRRNTMPEGIEKKKDDFHRRNTTGSMPDESAFSNAMFI